MFLGLDGRGAHGKALRLDRDFRERLHRDEVMPVLAGARRDQVLPQLFQHAVVDHQIVGQVVHDQDVGLRLGGQDHTLGRWARGLGETRLLEEAGFLERLTV